MLKHVQILSYFKRTEEIKTMDKAFITSLKSSGIKFVRILWCDNANIIRGKAIHIDTLEDNLTHGVGISAAQQAIPVMYDAVVPGAGLGPVGEVRLVPDWSSFNTLPYAPAQARVMGEMKQKGKDWPYCPRLFLKKMISEAEKEGFHIKTSFENEFYLLKTGTEEIIPADYTVFASTQSMDINQHVINEIAENLIAQGMIVEQYYPESGPGQQEITIQYTDPLKAADNQIAFRETVRAVASHHGLKASFLPKIFLDKAGSGCHIHLSLWKNEKNLVSNSREAYGLSKIAKSFIAGLLHHLPALMAITTPSTNSYRRIKPHYWSGAFRCWGVDNREAAVRTITDPKTNSCKQFEFKTSDATANPYLAMGAVIASGLDGIRQKMDIPSPVDIDPGNLSEEERKSAGIDKLPVNLGSALEYLTANRLLLDALGAELSGAYLAVRRSEWENMTCYELADEVELLMEKY
jgi:glutamine synthetase